jgi:tol-pal system protein YbgF
MNKLIGLGALGLLVLSEFASAATPAAPAQPATVQSLDQRLARIERVMDNKILLDLLQRVESLQVEVRELRGEIESQGFELESLKKRQRDLYLDTDRRLRDLEVGGARGTAPTGQPAVSTGGEVPLAGGTGESAPAAVGDPAGERDAYLQAFNQLKEGRYDAAIGSFEGFLQQYPSGTYSDNAQYWLGEANYVSRRFKQAITEFEKVLSQFPGSPKVADARLKLGYSHYELAQWDQAREVLNGLKRDFPNSSVAKLADQRLQRMQREGH